MKTGDQSCDLRSRSDVINDVKMVYIHLYNDVMDANDIWRSNYSDNLAGKLPRCPVTSLSFGEVVLCEVRSWPW